MLNLLSESQNLKLTGAPPPAAGPCPKFPQIDQFVDLKKYVEKTEKIAPEGSLGAPPNLKKSENRQKFQLMSPLGWSCEKALPPEAPRKPKGRKQGAISLIRSRRRNPNTVCIFPQNLKMSSKTPPRVSILDPIWQLWAPKGVQMSLWERSRRSLKFQVFLLPAWEPKYLKKAF